MSYLSDKLEELELNNPQASPLDEILSIDDGEEQAIIPSFDVAGRLTVVRRKLKDVADMFNIKTSDFTKAFKYVQEVLALAHQKGQLKGFSGSPSAIQSTRASHYIAHPLSKLPLKRSEFAIVLALSTKIADISEDRSICAEHMPPSLAAAALAEAVRLKGYKDISMESIAELCNVSAGTLLKCWKRIDESRKTWAEECGIVQTETVVTK